MSYYVQEAGRRFFADMLAGSGDKIDMMYVEYGPAASTDTGKRDMEYFQRLQEADDSGLIVVPVANAYADDNAVVHFSGLVRLDDTKLSDAQSTRLGCVTLAHGSATGDVLICTFGFPQDIKLIRGAYTTIRCSIDMGLGK